MTEVHPPDSTPDAARKALRLRAIAAREGLSAQDFAAHNTALLARLDGLMATLEPAVLGFCWPWRAEPDLREWVTRWLAGHRRRRAVLPVVARRGAAMQFCRWQPGMALGKDACGIAAPLASEPRVPALLLVPLNAFDAAGYRIGYGGGYFDRYLADSPTVSVGVGFELGRVADVAPQPHDRPMSWIVTEAGVFAPPASGKSGPG